MANFLDRTLAGKEKFLSVFIWLVVLPYVVVKLIAPAILLALIASEENNAGSVLKFLHLFLTFYFVLACYCLWKSTDNVSKDYRSVAKAGVVAIVLFLVVSPLVQTVAMNKIEDNLDAQFEGINGAAQLEPTLERVEWDDGVVTYEPINSHEPLHSEKSFHEVKEDLGLNSPRKRPE